MPAWMGRTPALIAVVPCLCALSLLLLLLLTGYHPSTLTTMLPTVSWASGSASTPTSPVSEIPSPNDGFGDDTFSACLTLHASQRDEYRARWGMEVLRASVARWGTGARVRRAMRRLGSEKRITVGILGGSITYGHGLQSGDKRYADLIREGLKETYPDAEIVVINGAVPATGTDYFSACYAHHLPVDADLYILEGAVNDLMTTANTDASVHQDTITDTETLVRELLKDGAAVVMLSTWGMGHGYMNGADSHSTVSEYYDIPRISTRAVLYQYVQEYPDETEDLFTHNDLGHFNHRGHRFMADSVLNYLYDQVCRPSYTPPYPGLRGSELKSAYDPFVLPPLRIRQRLGDKPHADPSAFCASANVKLDDGSWQLNGLAVDGHAPFEKMIWHDKHYWGADEVGARVTFENIEVHGGFVGIYYLRSGGMGLGNARCWVDGDEERGKLLIGQWGYVSVGSVGVVATGLTPGKHNLTCEVDKTTDSKMAEGVEGGLHKVRIIAVIAS